MRRTARACELWRAIAVVDFPSMARRSAPSFAVTALLVPVACLFCFLNQVTASVASFPSGPHAAKQHVQR